jgi:hypothetical protein
MRGQYVNLISVKVYFIQPDIIGLLLVVPIHLKLDVDSFLVPFRLGVVINVHIVGIV